MQVGDQILVWCYRTQSYQAPAFGGAKKSIKKLTVMAPQYIIKLSRIEKVDGEEATWVGTLPTGEEHFLINMTWAQIGDKADLPQQLYMAYTILQTHKPSDGWQITVDHPRQPSAPFVLSDFAMIGHCTPHNRYYARSWGCVECRLEARTAAQNKPK